MRTLLSPFLLLALAGCHPIDDSPAGTADAGPRWNDSSPHGLTYRYSGTISVSDLLSVPNGGQLLAFNRTSVSAEELPGHLATERLGELLDSFPWAPLVERTLPIDFDFSVGEDDFAAQDRVVIIMDVDGSNTVSAGDYYGQFHLDVNDFVDVGYPFFDLKNVEIVIDSVIPATK